MAILKLQNEGDSHTMTVSECKTVTGNYGEQVLFSDGTDTLYLPKQSADRQLERMGIDTDAAVGLTLTFSRDPNPKKGAKPYWGISYAGTQPTEAKPTQRVVPSKAKPANDDAFTRRKEIATAYCRLFDFVQSCVQHPMTPEAAQAATATIWITFDKRGIQPDGITDWTKPDAEQAPEVKMPEPSGKRLAPPDFSKFPPPTDDDLPF